MLPNLEMINWIKKEIPLNSKLDLAYGFVQKIWLSLQFVFFFFIQLVLNGTASFPGNQSGVSPHIITKIQLPLIWQQFNSKIVY